MIITTPSSNISRDGYPRLVDQGARNNRRMRLPSWRFDSLEDILASLSVGAAGSLPLRNSLGEGFQARGEVCRKAHERRDAGGATLSVFNRFETRPFEPLSKHMNKVKECVALVSPMFACALGGDYEALRRLTEQAFKTEHEADLIKDEIRHRIPKSFALPIFRGDLLAYLKLQDDMADSVEDIAVTLTIKDLKLPESLADDVRALVDQVLVVCDELCKASDSLKDLTENDFGGQRCEELLDMLASAERAEWEADKLQYTLARNLFALDDEMKATDIFLWSGVFQELGRLANHADKTAERLRRILSR